VSARHSSPSTGEILFVLAEPDGSIHPGTDQGMYSRDTRYVSNYEFFADGKHWVLQNSGAVAYYASRAYLTNPRIVTEYGEIDEGTIRLILDRAVSDGIHEDIDIHSYRTRRIRFSLELSLRTDFADIFEVKSKRLVRKGNRHWHSLFCSHGTMRRRIRRSLQSPIENLQSKILPPGWRNWQTRQT
jgi:glycogen debranching enzyme